MSKRFHITAKGEPKACTATVKPCPVGGEHFDDMATASRAAEELLATEFGGAAPQAEDPRASLLSSIADLKYTEGFVIKKREAVYATIQDEINKLDSVHTELINKRLKTERAYLDASRAEDLMREDTAKELYAIGWNGGSGHDGWSTFSDRIFKDTYIYGGGGQWAPWDGEEGKGFTSSSTSLYLSRDNFSQEKFNRSLELALAVHETARKLNPEVKITILHDSAHGELRFNPETKKWDSYFDYSRRVLESHATPQEAAASLLDYLRRGSD